MLALLDWKLWAAVAIAFAMGGAGGVTWQKGVQAKADLAASDARATEARRQIRFNDKASATHTTALATVNKKLGSAREKIALLSSRECLSDVTVGMLNDIGSDPVRTPTSQPAGAPPATATGGGLRFATERDVAGAIAVCRAGYSELSSQLNQILDIEDAREVAQ